MVKYAYVNFVSIIFFHEYCVTFLPLVDQSPLGSKLELWKFKLMKLWGNF